MPFKKLASAKKLANLGAEVVGIAPLESGSVVAAVTSDPVKVSVHPIGAGNNRVTNVSLDEAQAAALIDKKVAVVKSGDDLWALLDIQHTPKIEQVGRDIRSLHACPKGGTALAIGWDGNGAALGLQNHEVGGRQFVLRGDVRCASRKCCRPAPRRSVGSMYPPIRRTSGEGTWNIANGSAPTIDCRCVR